MDVFSDRQELHVHIVYWGAGLAGTKTNLELIFQGAPPETRSELEHMEFRHEVMTHFEFVPRSLPRIRGHQVHLHLYSATTSYFRSAKMTHAAAIADGFVFVADSQRGRREANLSAMARLVDDLASHGKALSDVPIVMQYNKRDLDTAMPLEELSADLDPGHIFSEFAMCAVEVNAPGIFESLETVLKLILTRLRRPPS